MFDVKAIRENPAAFDAGWAKRGLAPQADAIIALDKERRDIISTLQELQSKRNDASKQIGQAKASGDDDKAQSLIDEVARLKEATQENEQIKPGTFPVQDHAGDQDEIHAGQHDQWKPHHGIRPLYAVFSLT